MSVNKLQQAVLEALLQNDRENARRLLQTIIDDPSVPVREKAQAKLALGMTSLRAGNEDSLKTARKELCEGVRLSVLVGDESHALKGLRYLVEAVRGDEDAQAIEGLVVEIESALSQEGRAVARQVCEAARVVAELWKGIRSLEVPQITYADLRALVESGLLSEGYRHLFQAAELEQAADLLEAEKCAEKARKYALETVDPFLYLLSCAAIASLRDKRNERVQALTILFTCKASLEDLLGPEAGEQVVLLIDALERKWGTREFNIVLEEYRKQFE